MEKPLQFFLPLWKLSIRTVSTISALPLPWLQMALLEIAQNLSFCEVLISGNRRTPKAKWRVCSWCKWRPVLISNKSLLSFTLSPNPSVTYSPANSPLGLWFPQGSSIRRGPSRWSWWTYVPSTPCSPMSPRRSTSSTGITLRCCGLPEGCGRFVAALPRPLSPPAWTPCGMSTVPPEPTAHWRQP